MLLLDDLELDIFSLQDLKKLTGTHFNNVSELAENLIDKKILSRIERGKYCRANFRDESVIGCHLVLDGAVKADAASNKPAIKQKKATILGGFINNSGNMMSYKLSEKSASTGVVGANALISKVRLISSLKSASTGVAGVRFWISFVLRAFIAAGLRA